MTPQPKPPGPRVWWIGVKPTALYFDNPNAFERALHDDVIKVTGYADFQKLESELREAKAELAELRQTLHGVLDHGPPGAMFSGAWLEVNDRWRTAQRERDQALAQCEKLAGALKNIESASFYTDEIQNCGPYASEALKAYAEFKKSKDPLVKADLGEHAGRGFKKESK